MDFLEAFKIFILTVLFAIIDNCFGLIEIDVRMMNQFFEGGLIDVDLADAGRVNPKFGLNFGKFGRIHPIHFQHLILGSEASKLIALFNYYSCEEWTDTLDLYEQG